VHESLIESEKAFHTPVDRNDDGEVDRLCPLEPAGYTYVA
jgi:hypothetical protein